MRYTIGKANRLGNRYSNQDRFAVIERPNSVLLVLADGMGGHQGGNLAADTVVLKITENFTATPHPIPNPRDFFTTAFINAHQAVLELGAKFSPPIQPRSTVVACLIQDNAVWHAHLGDSRFYLFRYAKVVIRTQDHSVVEQLIQQGKLKEKQRLSHPARNQVTRCVGGTTEARTISIGEKTGLEPNDVVLLCSDGLWGAIDDDRTGVTLCDDSDIARAVDTICHQAEMDSYPKSDNVSAVALRWIDEQASHQVPRPATGKAEKPAPVYKSPELTQADEVVDEITAALKRAEELKLD